MNIRNNMHNEVEIITQKEAKKLFKKKKKKFDQNNEISKYLLNYRFLNSKINECYLELGVLTKNVTVMLLIVLAEAALR